MAWENEKLLPQEPDPSSDVFIIYRRESDGMIFSKQGPLNRTADGYYTLLAMYPSKEIANQDGWPIGHCYDAQEARKTWVRNKSMGLNTEGPSYQPEPRPSAGLWNDGPYMLYESKNTGLILLETEKRYYAELRAGGGTWSLTTFQNFPHMKANGFNPDWGQEQRRWWVAEMRKDGWKRFQPAPSSAYTPWAIMDAAAAHVEDPSAARDREAMKNRPPVVQTQKPVPTPVERPLCPVGMLNVTPINKWGRPQ